MKYIKKPLKWEHAGGVGSVVEGGRGHVGSVFSQEHPSLRQFEWGPSHVGVPPLLHQGRAHKVGCC